MDPKYSHFTTLKYFTHVKLLRMTKLFHQILKTCLDLFEIVLICLCVFLLAYLFVGQLLEVTGDSMYPNFHDKDRVLSEKISIKFTDVQRSEIIIFEHPTEKNRLLIKRVVGLPGETIKISNGRLYINGVILEEPYLNTTVNTTQEQAFVENQEYKIPDDSFVVMGDNRSKSTDSREWGFLSKKLIVGRAVLIYFPIEHIKFIKSGII